MCIPPITGDSNNYYSKMSNLAKVSHLNELSMGMSSDYLDAINFNSTFVRIGSKIFGPRS